MPSFTITSHKTNEILFEGDFVSLRKCVESAVANNVSLRCAYLANADLSHACLDGADFTDACLDGTDLTDTNLSEADLTGASCVGANCTQTCFCETRLTQVNFRDASFCLTLLTDALIDACLFTCPSALTLPFSQARLGQNLYEHDGKPLAFTAPPIVVTGLSQVLAFLDDTALIGNRAYPRESAPFDLPEALKTFTLAALH